MNLFQGIRLLSNAPGAVAAGGAMILLARTQDGFGNAEIEHQLCGLRSMAERETALRTTFSIGGYVGFLFAEAAEKYYLILVTDMDQQRFARTCIHAVPTGDKALELAATFLGGSLNVPTTVMPWGAAPLPRVAGK